MRESDVYVVQFIHPGGEHRPDQSDLQSWNRKAHRRKFMRSAGRYVDESGADRRADLVFWGEWEANSRAVQKFSRVPQMPRYLVEPFYEKPASYEGLQNTDPFVFGKHFFYTGCQQHTNRGRTETFLRWMAPGSLILFGSCEGRSHFVLDTVFVVARYIDHNFRDYQRRLGGEVSRAYEDVTLAAWYAGGETSQSFRLHVSASLDQPFSGMFSFFPCTPEGLAREGFAKPRIELPGFITPHLTQGKKGNRCNISAVENIWRDVRRQVFEQDLVLGVQAALPPETRHPVPDLR